MKSTEVEEQLLAHASALLPRLKVLLHIAAVHKTQYLESDLEARLAAAYYSMTPEDLVQYVLQVLHLQNEFLSTNSEEWDNHLKEALRDLLTYEIRGPFITDTWCQRIGVDVTEITVDVTQERT